MKIKAIFNHKHIPDDTHICCIVLTTLLASGLAAYVFAALSQGTMFSASFQFIGIFAFAFAGASVLFPYYKLLFRQQCKSIGLVNKSGMTPRLYRERISKDNPRIIVLTVRANSVSLGDFEGKRAAVEAALNCTIVNMEYGKDHREVIISAIHGSAKLPDMLPWTKEKLSPKDFALSLGESLLGEVTVNLADYPHLLIGGATGSGKTVLLKLLLMQSYIKGAALYIADLKGGVDFPAAWRKVCNFVTNESEALAALEHLVAEIERRKTLLVRAGYENIDEYNAHADTPLQPIIFACDEVAELLDKTGRDKDGKALVDALVSALSKIARLGRAFGIHLFLATQRPDAGVLIGQIKNNIPFRICGVADSTLSMIILDSPDAATRIPANTHGRFLLHDGTLFQAYWCSKDDMSIELEGSI